MAYIGVDIGGVTGSFSFLSGTYTVNCTGGSGINGTSDSYFFAYQSVSGNIELISKVATQSGTNAYATSGLMVSDLSSSYPASSQCAMIGVSPENGVNFWYRTSDNTTANMTLGPSLTVPIWLRLVVSQSSVAGYVSSDGISWQLVGECTLTFPATFYAGMLVYSNASGTTNTATFTNLYQLTNVPQRVTGLLPNWTETDIGTATGSFTANAGGTYTVTGSGTGIAGTTDDMFLANQQATGNITVTCLVSTITDQTEYSFGGLLISDMSPTYPQASQLVALVVFYSAGLAFVWRTTDNTDAADIIVSGPVTPLWLRLVMSPGLVTGYQSTDGINWTVVDTVAITFPSTFYIGFVVGSDNTEITTVTFGSAAATLNAFLLCWLRSDVNVTYSGSAVSLWSDQSGQGYNASQSTSSNQPSLVTNAINGLPAISFNGTSSFMQFPTGFSNFAQGLSIFIVVNPAATTSLSQILNLGTGSSNDYNLGIEINSSTEAEYFVYNSAGGGMTGVSYGSTMSTGAQLIEVVQSGTSATIYTNGANPVTNNSMNSIPTPTAGRTNSYIGQASGGGNYFDGQVAELLIYNTSLSTAQRQSIENYLIGKYAL